MESKKVLFVADLGLEASIFAGVVGGWFYLPNAMPTNPYFFLGGGGSIVQRGGGVGMYICL